MAMANNGRGAGKGAVPRLTIWWWLPSAVVILALLVLLIVPSEIDRRARSMREQVTAGEHARAALNDFEAALATELLLRSGEPGVTHTPADTLDADLAEVHAALRRLEDDGLEHYDSLSVLLDAWRGALREGDPTARRHGIQLIATAETLDGFLARYVDAHRSRALSLTRYYVVIPAVLAPIAVAAMLLATWMAWRMQLLTRVAESERAEVVRAAESRAALLRGVTHDVKNPLGAASGYAQLLEEGIVGPLDPKQTDMVRRIRHLLGTSIQTVTDLLELARADGTLQLEYASIDLSTIVTEVVDDHRGMARERDLNVHVEAMDGPTAILTDPLRVRQILGNLLTNAIKYTPTGGRIGARIVRDKSRVGVAIDDTGPGIPPELERKLFEEFFRVRGEAKGPGNGLGLAISQRIAHLLGGEVSYRRNDGTGSIFTLWLPGRQK